MTLWGGHIGGICKVEWLDFMMVSWFLYVGCYQSKTDRFRSFADAIARCGMVDMKEPGPWVAGDQRPLNFEGRISEIIWPFMERDGIQDMQPNLVIASSIYWDDSFLWHVRPVSRVQDTETRCAEIHAAFEPCRVPP